MMPRLETLVPYVDCYWEPWFWLAFPLGKAYRVLPTNGGVYVALSASGQALYVGQTDNLQRRLRSHNRRAEWSVYACQRLAWYCCDRRYRRDLESALVLHLHPLLNRQPQMPTSLSQAIAESLPSSLRLCAMPEG